MGYRAQRALPLAAADRDLRVRGKGLGADDWNQIVHPDDFSLYRTALRDCLRGVTARDCEYRVRHTDGTYRWIEDRALPVRDKAGRAVRLVGAVSDVTQRKAVEQALRDNEERYSPSTRRSRKAFTTGTSKRTRSSSRHD